MPYSERRLIKIMIFANSNCTRNDNFVYLNKIFYNEKENSSPIITALDSATAEHAQQLNISSNLCKSTPAPPRQSSCNCNNNTVRAINTNCCCDCCCDFAVTADTTFDITNSYVIVHSYNLTTPADLTAADVTIEGLPITELTVSGNQFTGNISGILPQIMGCSCKPACANTCSGNFIMITAAGPWELSATIVVEGNVYRSGSSCQFRICFNTAEGSLLAVTGAASFAFCGIDIPCQISGMAPYLMFDFDACVKLLNPAINVTCTEGVCTPVLTGSLVITPTVSLQIVRPSLFNLGECEVPISCDDFGQCNPCNLAEAECIEPSDNCCCNDNTRKEPQQADGISCQYCGTNGFGF